MTDFMYIASKLFEIYVITSFPCSNWKILVTNSHRIEVNFLEYLADCSSKVIVTYLLLFRFRLPFLFHCLFPFVKKVVIRVQ